VGSEDCFVAELGEREAEVDVTKVGKKERGGGGASRRVLGPASCEEAKRQIWSAKSRLTCIEAEREKSSG
jgi:hypothetical protein